MSTKSLAKELGLIRSRRQSSGAHPCVRKQRFSFLIIIDFESTCWREKNSSGQEIIEFPAVLLNVSSGEIESEFHTFVQPQERPVLSDFCTQLTGITQDQVDSAPPLHICLSRFVRWLLRLQQERGVAFEMDSTASAPSRHPCAFVTWSDWDLGVCLLYECKRKQLRVPEALKSWIDLRATYRLFYNRKPKGLRGALLDLGIQFTGREHSGLVDARNTALLAWQMVCDGCLLTVTKSLRRVKSRASVCRSEAQTSVCRSEAQTSVCRALVTPQTSVCRSEAQTSKCRSEAQTRVCQALVTPHTLLSSTSTTALAGLSDTTYDPETPESCWTDGVLLTEEEEPVSYDAVPLGAEPVSYDAVPLGAEPVSYDAVPWEAEPVAYDAVPLGAEPVSCDAVPLGAEPDENTASISAAVFKTPKPLPRTDPYGPLSCFLGHSSAPFSIYTDPPISKTRPPHSAPFSISTALPISKPLPLHSAPLRVSTNPPTSKPCPPHSAPFSIYTDTPTSKLRPPLSVKRTAPLCGCGRRARRLSVGNGGPNHGRGFYCCPARRHTHQGCQFFQWESALLQQNQYRPAQTGLRALR